MNTKTPAATIIQTRNILRAGIPTIRRHGNRKMMRETVMRIRQLEGILEVRARG